MLPELFFTIQFHFAFDLNIISDAPLHPMVTEALADQGPLPAYEDNAHVYLMGVVASEDDDSFEVGKQRFISMGETHMNGERQAYKVYPKAKWSKVKDEPRLCMFSGEKVKQIACADKLRISCTEMDALLTQYQVPLGNYRRVLVSTEIRSPSDRSLTDWYTLEEFRALGMLAGISHRFEFQCGLKEDREVVTEIYKQAKALRRFAAETDDLILRVMLQVVLRDFYQWQVFNYRNNSTVLSQLPDSFFNLQTLQESGLRKVMQAQIRDQVSLMKRAREQAMKDGEHHHLVTEWFYKKNLTANDMARSYRNAILDSEVPIDRYLEDRLPTTPDPYFKWWRVGNYTGEILSMIATPRWINTSVDMNNLDLIIRLSDIAINYSELVDNNQLSSLPLAKRNPYDNSLPYFGDSGKLLCFKVPEELKTQDECIYLN